MSAISAFSIIGVRMIVLKISKIPKFCSFGTRGAMYEQYVYCSRKQYLVNRQNLNLFTGLKIWTHKRMIGTLWNFEGSATVVTDMLRFTCSPFIQSFCLFSTGCCRCWFDCLFLVSFWFGAHTDGKKYRSLLWHKNLKGELIYFKDFSFKFLKIEFPLSLHEAMVIPIEITMLIVFIYNITKYITGRE